MKRTFLGASLLRSRVPHHPWLYFPVFLVSLTLLSYGSLSLSGRLWVGIFGVAFPLGLGLWRAWERRLKKPPRTPTLTWPAKVFPATPPPLWTWILFLGLLFFTRSFSLTSIPSWPLSDEGIFSLLAMEFGQRPRAQLLFAEGRIEPLLIWSMGAFYHLVEPSLFSVRLYPTLLSLLSVLLAYWALRPLFPPMYSFVFLWLFTFSFWGYSLMRFCTPEDLIPPVEFLALGCLARFLLAGKPAARSGWLLALSASSVLGFYSYINWAPIWSLLTLSLLLAWWRSSARDARPFAVFQILHLLLLTPLVLARLAPGGLSYIRQSWGEVLSPHSWWVYLEGLFCRSLPSFPFAPNWGGMIDPITGALILLGVFAMVEKLHARLLGLLGLGFLATMLPGTVTNYMELHRVTPSLPLWIFLAAWGALALVPGKGKGVLAGLGLAVAALNYYSFIGPYSDLEKAPPGRQWRAVEYQDAYRVLESQRKGREPLYIFSEFSMDYDNKTLNVACYPFDALQKPELAKDQPALAALLVKVDYAPYLLSAFPGTRFKVLRDDKASENSLRTGLFLIPTASLGEARLKAWIRADGIFRAIHTKTKDRNPLTPWGAYAEELMADPGPFASDPFLKTLFWEKVAFFRYVNGDFLGAGQAYENALQVGLGIPHLAHNHSLILRLLGKTKGTGPSSKGGT